ncbi:hypothetical protein, partial [Candidatus Phytoplasma pruni]
MSLEKFKNKKYRNVSFIIIISILTLSTLCMVFYSFSLSHENQALKQQNNQFNNEKQEHKNKFLNFKPSSETTQSQPFFLTQEQLPLLNDEFLQILNEEQVKNILPETIPKMKWELLKTKTHFLTKEQLQYLSQYSPKFLGDYTPYNFFNHHESFVKMSPESLPLIPPLGLSQVKPQTYNQLSKEQIQAF